MAFKMRSGYKPEFKEMGSSHQTHPQKMMGQGDSSSPNKVLPVLGAAAWQGARMLGTWALRKGAQKLAQKGGKEMLKKTFKTQMSKTKNLLPVKYKPKKMELVKYKPKTNFTRPKTGAPKGKLPKDIDKLTPQKTFGQLLLLWLLFIK